MDENSELEEGEAYCYRDDDNNIEPDTDLSYIDERVQNVLGHYRKDFEAGVSKESLGSKYGGYGSFLPTYERSPSNWSHSNTPQRDCPILCNLSMEGTSQNFQPTSIVSSWMRLGTVSCGDNSLQNSGVPPCDGVPVKHGSRLSSARIAENSVRSGNLTDQRTLKVRIKLGSDKTARKNMALYSGLGLGLDDSPSSSLENSAEESGGTKSMSRETADESPTSIFQVMTSFPVPGGVLMSPLQESLVCLIRKERTSRDNEHLPYHGGSCRHSFVSVDKSVSCMGNQKLLKEKKANLMGRSARPVEQKHETDVKDVNDTACLLKKKLENEAMGRKGINHNDSSDIKLSNSECVFGSLKGSDRAPEVFRGIDKDGVSDRLFSSNLEMDNSLQSIYAQNSGKSQKNGKSNSQNSGKVSGQGNSGIYKGKKASAVLKAHSGASKCNEDMIVPSKQKVGKKPPHQVQDEINLCSGRTKPLSEGKKSKGNRSREKSSVLSIKESLRDGVGVAPKDTATTSYGASTGKSKMPKLKSQKNINKARDIRKDSLESNLKLTNNQLERPFSDKPFSDKPNKKVDNQVMSAPSIKDAPFVGPSTTEGRHGSEMVPTVVDPVVINENWVCCDSCQKWRLLPFGTKPEQLPENWLCSMLNWLPGMNRCDISEEETTKAIHALCQLPIVEGPNNVQNYAKGVASGINVDHGQQLVQKNQSFYSAAVSIRAKKMCVSKEIRKAGGSGRVLTSNTTKNYLKDSVRSRSLNDVNQPLGASNAMKKSSSLHFNKSCNLGVEKQITEQEKKQMNGGDSKQLKMKKKRVADQYGHRSSKKAKIDNMYVADKHRNSDVDNERVSLKSNAGLQTEAGRKNILKHELSYSGDTKCQTLGEVPLSRKKLGDQAQVSSGGTPDKRHNSLTKRKQQDNQNGNDSKEYVKEESSEGGLRREKKSRFKKMGSRDSSANKGSDTKYDNRVTSFFSRKSHLIDSVEDVRSADKGQQMGKHKRNFASQPTTNSLDLVRRDFGSGEVSVAATSSSSKVSGSCKSRANLEEVKGSPVESVSSSPFRTSYPDKLISVAEDIFGKDDSGTDCVPVNNSAKRCWDGEGNDKIQSGTVKMEKGSFEHCQHPGGLHVTEHSNNEGRGNQNYHENILFPRKVDEGSFLRAEDSDRKCASVSFRDKMKVSDSLSGHGDFYLRKSLTYEPDIDFNCNAQYREIINEGKNQLPEKPRSKFHMEEKHHISRRDFERLMPSDGGMGKLVIIKEHDSDVNLCSSGSREVATQQNLVQDLKGEVKATQFERETINGTSKLLSHCESNHDQRTRGHQSVPESRQGGMSDEVLIDDSCKADISKALKHSGNVANGIGLGHSSGHHTPVIHGIKDVNAPNPRIMKSLSQNATTVLKEAKELRAYADRLKNSGFDFECNEAYFQAALKFFNAASLLESCSDEGGRNGDMTQIQAYRTTAKLSEFCAHEYERRQEMAAASLAYKCMEVAYMRVVYCKNSSTSRDRIELQATLHITSQGESPSSSASDVDNFNQVTADKATLSKGTVSHVTGNHVIVARKHPNLIRLLDFTQDVDFAMEASRKSQNAFATANVTLEEVQNRECITIIKRVIDFSFQDVEGLLHLIPLAMEAINRSGFGGARD